MRVNVSIKPHLSPDAEPAHVPAGGERQQVKAVHARRLHTGQVAESAVNTLFFESAKQH